MISEQDTAIIVEGVVNKLNERRYISEETHHRDHEWLGNYIKAQEARAEFWQGVRDSLVKQGVIRAFWTMITLALAGAVAWFGGFFHGGGPHSG